MNDPRLRRPRPPLPVVLILAAGVFAGGVLLARQGLGDWQARIVSEDAVRRAFGQLAALAGVQLLSGRTLPHLDTSSGETLFAGQAKARGDLTPRQAATWTAGLIVERSGVLPGDAAPHDLAIRFAWDGRPLEVRWTGSAWVGLSAAAVPRSASPQLMERFSRMLLLPGESSGRRVPPPRSRNAPRTNSHSSGRAVWMAKLPPSAWGFRKPMCSSRRGVRPGLEYTT